MKPKRTAHPSDCLSATAETLNSSGAPKSYGHLTICNNHRNLSLALAVLQHFFHLAGVELHVIIDMLLIRLTGASSMGSALFAIDDDLGHFVFSLQVIVPT